MSNHKAGENPAHRKSEVSWAMIIIPGLVGPKPRQCSVGDGQRVNIPVPAVTCSWMFGMVTEAGFWLYPSNPSNGRRMKRPQGWISVIVPTRKVHELMVTADRTANRHRCSGRVAQGVRVILRQGTRQYSDRNFGIRSALPQ